MKGRKGIEMGKYFGTDGFRGEAGITLTADHAYKVGVSSAGIIMLSVSVTTSMNLPVLLSARIRAAQAICSSTAWLLA